MDADLIGVKIASVTLCSGLSHHLGLALEDRLHIGLAALEHEGTGPVGVARGDSSPRRW